MTEKEALFNYCLRLGDNSLILGHRLSEWCGHGPVLETDIAMINISLDLIGQARSFLSLAGEVENKGRDEDALAYLRDVFHFKNVLLAELENGDFGFTMVRQFLYDSFHFYFFQELSNSSNPQLAAIAQKSLKETTYHLRFSSEWIIRLGDGTEESKKRVQYAIDDLWEYGEEFFEKDEVENTLITSGIAVDTALIKDKVDAKRKEILETASLSIPSSNFHQSGGRVGKHSENLGYILAEMQFLQRAYPNATW